MLEEKLKFRPNLGVLHNLVLVSFRISLTSVSLSKPTFFQFGDPGGLSWAVQIQAEQNDN